MTVLIAFFTICGTSYAAVAANAARKPGVISIEKARGLPLGTVVTVQGTVTVPSGAFFSGTDDNGFAIQDNTAGIFVSMDLNIHLKLNRHVRVTGQLFDNFGLLSIGPVLPHAVTRQGFFGPRIVPQWFATGDIGEATEGLLVKIVGTIKQIEPDTQSGAGFRVFVDDDTGLIQVLVNTSAGIDVSGLLAGDVISVVGLGSHFQDNTTNHFEIDPRAPEDIVKRTPRLTP